MSQMIASNVWEQCPMSKVCVEHSEQFFTALNIEQFTINIWSQQSYVQLLSGFATEVKPFEAWLIVPVIYYYYTSSTTYI